MIEWPFLESDWLREWLPAQSIKRSMARTKESDNPDLYKEWFEEGS